jgi:uncharacterized protein (TIGR00255 family)
MTGYASVQRDLPAMSLSLELRSVNARFLDLSFKIPDELRGVEPMLRQRLAGAVRRGKLECRIGCSRRSSAPRKPALDRVLLVQLSQVSEEIRTIVPGALPMSVAELLRWPGVLGEERTDPAGLNNEIVSMAQAALGEFSASRVREGEQLAGALLQRIARIEVIVAELTQAAPALLAHFEERLTERLRLIIERSSQGSSVPAEETFARVRQEIAAHGLRIDVAEELSRLSAHAAEVRRLLAAGGEVGKRLDFLMQELNREANTLGSKSAAAQFTDSAVELKVLIEQMREQIQNIE